MSDDKARDPNAETPTRLDPAPEANASPHAATRIDSAGFATRLDPDPSDARKRGVGHDSLVNLPAALAERFEIERSLPAPGAEADLVLVRSRQDGERFVAKIYRYGTHPKSEVLEAVSRSNPEHVIGLYEHGVSSGRAFELLEYAPYGSLRDLHPEGTPLDTESVRAVLIELAEALHHLHQQNVVHRDLKPANVLVRSVEPLDLVLTDFGIASASEATVHYTSAHRTIAYAAPETIAGEVSTASDFWSLGIIVSELVTGRHPLRGMTEVVMQARLVSHDVPTRQLPAPWDDFCAGLLRRDPGARWQYDEIQAWLRGEATGQPPRRFKLPDVNWRRVADAVPRFDIPRRGRRDQATGSDGSADARGSDVRGDKAPHTEPAPGREPAPEQDSAAAAERSYTFDKGRYATPAALAKALARNPTNAHKHVARGYVGKWLAEELRDYDLANRVQDLAERYAASPELLVLAVTTSLDPTRQAIFRGLPLDRSALVDAVREIVLEPSRERLAIVDEVFESDLVRLVAEARHDEEFVNVAHTWQLRWTALVSALSNLRPLAGLVRDVQPPEAARAMLLLATLDTSYVSTLKGVASRLLESRTAVLAPGRRAIGRYRKAHADPVSVDVAVMALHAAKQAELDAGSASQRLLEDAGTLDAVGAQRFLEAGASVDGPKPDDITPLMVAARHNRDAGVIEALLRAGANIEAGRNKGRTPLLVAARYNPSVEVIRALLAAGADLHALDRERRTALVRAARFNTNPGVVSALVAAGAVVGDAVRWVAQSNPNPDVARTVAALLPSAAAAPRTPTDQRPTLQWIRYWRPALWIIGGATVLLNPALWLPAILVLVSWFAYKRSRSPKRP